MSDAFWMTFFQFLATAVVAWLSYRTHLTAAKTHEEVKEVVRHTNGMQAALISAAGKAGVIQGAAEEVQRQRDRRDGD